ncbi:MAG: hypothetical protein QM630_03630 [Microbacterium sp.]
MTGGETTRASGLTRRSWIRVSAILPVTAGATIAGCCAVAGFSDGPLSVALVSIVLVLGGIAGMLWRSKGGVDAVHRRVAAARAAWVQGRSGATAEPDGVADPRDVALSLPRGWRVDAARGRLRFTHEGFTVRAETWVLKAVVGSRRAPRRREIVIAEAPTGAVRLWIPLGVAADSMLVTPAWGREPARTGPGWFADVRDRVSVHDDILASLTIGDDRVILLALDDPRPETMRRRVELVRDVAAIIKAAHIRP